MIVLTLVCIWASYDAFCEGDNYDGWCAAFLTVVPASRAVATIVAF